MSKLNVIISEIVEVEVPDYFCSDKQLKTQEGRDNLYRYLFRKLGVKPFPEEPEYDVEYITTVTDNKDFFI